MSRSALERGAAKQNNAAPIYQAAQPPQLAYNMYNMAQQAQLMGMAGMMPMMIPQQFIPIPLTGDDEDNGEIKRAAYAWKQCKFQY